MEQTVSVIVPVYNCEDYLPRCIESILSQTHSQIQLILVDDGSSDGSGEVCDSYALQDSRVVVHHQQNGGVSRARNAGLGLADGKWVLFVDADDCVEQDYCSKMMFAAVENQADVVIARPYSESWPEIYVYPSDEIEDLKKGCLAYDETRFDYNIDGPWGKLFRQSIIEQHHLRFPERLSRSEDAHFCASFYEHSSSVCCLNWFGYHHSEREGSLCRKFSPESPDMLERILDENQKWVKLYHPDDQAYEKALWYRALPGIDECERQYFLHKDNPDTWLSKTVHYTRLVHGGLVGKAIRSMKIKDVPKRQYRIRLMFYKMHLGWFFLLLKMVRGKG